MPSLCLEWHSLHVTFTPLPWQGCAPGLAGSLGTQPGAETSLLLPTQCSAPCLLSSHHCTPAIPGTLELQAQLRFGSTHPQPRHDSLHSIQTFYTLPCPGSLPWQLCWEPAEAAWTLWEANCESSSAKPFMWSSNAGQAPGMMAVLLARAAALYPSLSASNMVEIGKARS